VLFVALGTPEEAARFFADLWPEARVICDPGRELYRGFGLGEGSLGQLIGPSVWGAGLRALLGGHVAGLPGREVRQLSGAVLVEDGRVVWRHEARHAGDLPDFRAVGQSAG
jgi:hypothetical protein